MQVFLPVSVGTQWSLYAWDFARKQVTIFDPLISNIDRLKEKHKHAATKLHKYLLACKNEIFGNSLYLNIKWHLKYLPGNHENTRYLAFLLKYNLILLYVLNLHAMAKFAGTSQGSTQYSSPVFLMGKHVHEV